MGVVQLNQTQKSETGTLSLEGKTLELPVLTGSEGEKAIDIAALRSSTGYVTLDPAYMNTASCLSNITFLDGELGILKYRGLKIEDLALKSNFMEVSYLLLNGNLPTKEELHRYEEKIRSHGKTPEFIKSLLPKYPKNSHPMAILSAMMVSLSCENQPFCKQDLSKDERREVILQITSQIKNIAAYTYRVQNGKEMLDPPKGTQWSYTKEFLYQMFSDGKTEPDETLVKALDILFILHADHEQNCSTSTVRLVGSSKANPYATISGGMDALWGPLHGGANQAVIEMLEAIAKDGGGYKKFIDRAKDKNDNFVLMGFGHRVYKNFDPRAKIIKQACDEVLKKLGVKDPLLEIAKGLEETALSDPYFIERKLYPNVDFYSGIIYKALKIPTNMFTVMFALGRLPGWLAQWNEMFEGGGLKIGRPRQIYTGEVDQNYVEIHKRK